MRAKLSGRKSARRATGVSLGVHRLEDRDVPSTVMPDYVLHHGAGGAAFSSTPGSAYGPSQISHAYSIGTIPFPAPLTGANGAGQTIAIIDTYDDPNIANDLAQFDAQYNLPAPPSFRKVNEDGNASPLPPIDPTGGWEIEESLDVEWAHAVAPQANIILVECNLTLPPRNQWDDLVAHGVNWARNQPGVSVVSMSFGYGESSPETSYDGYFTTPSGHAGVTFIASTGDNGTPQYPALSPNVLAAGGTTIGLDANGYINAESVWDNSWGTTGGGLSSFEGRPGYQNSVASSVGSQRGIPDVAFDADPNTGVAVYDSYNGGTSTPWSQLGGTSLSAPAWAGLIAVTQQLRAAKGLGTLDGPTQTLPLLYQAQQTDFHDITNGNNGSYPAQAGYDLVTGRGTPEATALVSYLTNQTPQPFEFAIGRDNAVYKLPLNADGTPVSGAAYSQVAGTATVLAIAGARDGYGDPLLFVIGDDNAVWELKMTANGTSYGGYQQLAGTTQAVKAIAATNDASGDPVLYVVEQDNTVWELRMDPFGNPVSPYFQVSGAVQGVSASRDAYGDPLLFAVISGQAYELRSNGAGSPTTGYLSVAPNDSTVVQSVAGSRDWAGQPVLFIEKTNGVVSEMKFDASGYSLSTSYTDVAGSNTVLGLSAGMDGNGDPLLMVLGDDYQAWELRFNQTADPITGYNPTQPGAYLYAVGVTP